MWAIKFSSKFLTLLLTVWPVEVYPDLSSWRLEEGVFAVFFFFFFFNTQLFQLAWKLKCLIFTVVVTLLVWIAVSSVAALYSND